MNTAMTLLLVSVMAIGVQGVYAQKLGTVGAAPHVQRVQMATVNFVGNLHGIEVVATMGFEQLYNYVLMVGQIRSSRTAYMLHVDLVDTSGFGEAVCLADGQRIPIRIDMMPAGFALTSNPFGPGMPTTYYFE